LFEVVLATGSFMNSKRVEGQGLVEDELLSEGRWMELVREAATLGAKHLMLSGGEPLTTPLEWVIAREASDLGLTIRMNTAGPALFLPWKHHRWLLIDRIFVTVYSSNSRQHDEFAGSRGSLSKIWRGLRRCRRLGVPVCVRFPVLESNHEHLEEVKQLAQLHDAAFEAVWAFFPLAGEDRLFCNRLKGSRKRRELTRHLNESFPGPKTVERDFPICTAVHAFLAIEPNGDVIPCPAMPMVIDQVRDRTLADVWVRDPSPHLLRIRGLELGDLEQRSGCPHDFCCRCPGSSFDGERNYLATTTEACAQCQRDYRWHMLSEW